MRSRFLHSPTACVGTPTWAALSRAATKYNSRGAALKASLRRLHSVEAWKVATRKPFVTRVNELILRGIHLQAEHSCGRTIVEPLMRLPAAKPHFTHHIQFLSLGRIGHVGCNTHSNADSLSPRAGASKLVQLTALVRNMFLGSRRTSPLADKECSC